MGRGKWGGSGSGVGVGISLIMLRIGKEEEVDETAASSGRYYNSKIADR